MTIELLPADQERAKIFKALSEAKFYTLPTAIG